MIELKQINLCNYYHNQVFIASNTNLDIRDILLVPLSDKSQKHYTCNATASSCCV